MSVKSRQKYSKIIRRRKQKIERRLKRKQWEDQERPMFKGRNIQYGAINNGLVNENNVKLDITLEENSC